MSPFGPLIPPQPVVYSHNQPSLPSHAPHDANISPRRAIFLATRHSTLATSHRPLFSYSYGLFVVPKTVKSFAIKQIRTLCAKYREWGISAVAPRTLRPCVIVWHRFLIPLFSGSYKSLFPQPLSFHIYTKPGGWGVPLRHLSDDLCVSALSFAVAFVRSSRRFLCPPLSTFRINTCKSVSKQRTLTIFRMNTYEKQGEGGYCGVSCQPRKTRRLLD